MWLDTQSAYLGGGDNEAQDAGGSSCRLSCNAGDGTRAGHNCGACTAAVERDGLSTEVPDVERRRGSNWSSVSRLTAGDEGQRLRQRTRHWCARRTDSARDRHVRQETRRRQQGRRRSRGDGYRLQRERSGCSHGTARGAAYGTASSAASSAAAGAAYGTAGSTASSTASSAAGGAACGLIGNGISSSS